MIIRDENGVIRARVGVDLGDSRVKISKIVVVCSGDRRWSGGGRIIKRRLGLEGRGRKLRERDECWCLCCVCGYRTTRTNL